ncbi:hypothetical protein GCM10012275_33780 [Longimycelium tulufanense]|uniref:Uncharacterized protein n=1 Tax=Longimycelium tulufanense TaxID=907463 RepID=A0A8J3CFY7_9PSEU|nr:hypothetical protein [Longimycelium tulufanense]GGM59914.1 hypothetical protein GCM10012275_33780 [Longimycelium tulufanense]
MTMRNDAPPGGREENLAELAEALFCSPLRPADHPSPDQVRAAVRASLLAHSNDPGLCACELAQAYGEYPEITVTRMRWCREAVAEAYGLGLAAH